MVTGIIEEIGIINKIFKINSKIFLEINCRAILEEMKIGDSICVDGVCLTVTSFTKRSFSAELTKETNDLTIAQFYRKSVKVNLERAMKLSDRLGGHLISGHVEGIGTFNKKDNNNYYFKTPLQLTKYLIYKGSIAINGVSLTISHLKNNQLQVTLIAETLKRTNLSLLKINDKVNLETDMIAKYVEKLCNR